MNPMVEMSRAIMPNFMFFALICTASVTESLAEHSMAPEVTRMMAMIPITQTRNERHSPKTMAAMSALPTT